MSSKPAQSHLLERVASRRTVVRGAAWTTAAVTVVVATPNIAAATPGVMTPAVTVTSVAPIKYGTSTKYVAWDINVTSINMSLSGLVLELSYVNTGGGATSTLDEVVVRNYAIAGDNSKAGTWDALVTKAVSKPTPATAMATYTTDGGVVAQGIPAHIHLQYRGSDNSGGELKAVLKAKNSAGVLVQVANLPTTGTSGTTWDPGSAHTHA